MTLEEAIIAAKKGDIGAMCSLGDYYSKQNTGAGIEESVKWYEMAAKKNVMYAVHMTVLMKQIIAYASLQVVGSVSEFDLQFLFEDLTDFQYWAAHEVKLIQNHTPGYEKINFIDAQENFRNGNYYLALCYSEMKLFPEAITLLKDFTDTRSKLLYGQCLFNIAKTIPEYEKVSNLLQALEYDDTYVKSPNKLMIEEKILTLATMKLSVLYREGIISNSNKSNLDTAYELLTYVKPLIKHKGLQELITEELTHYSKTLFGGYKYIS